MSWSETMDALKVSSISEEIFDWIFTPVKKSSLIVKRRK